jgi:hypothetical protein
MLSLYDYLGKAAGTDLGKQVADYAAYKKAKIETRDVSNPRYTGKVMLYEKSFLDEFFKIQSVIGTNRSQNNTFQSNIL